MLNCHPVATPVDTKAKISALEGSPALDAPFYRSIIGALQYLTLTKPDLQYAVQQVCLHMHAPRDSHWTLVKRILRYIRGTMSLGLTLTASTSLEMVAYSDALGRLPRHSSVHLWLLRLPRSFPRLVVVQATTQFRAPA